MSKIIVVEDNLSYAEDVAEYLTGVGYETEIVPNADGLWFSLSREGADVILLDLGLPDEDGFNLIPKLRKLYPDMGLIILTARGTTDNRIQGLRLGADGYLIKPIKFPELAAHIEALCRRMPGYEKTKQSSSWALRLAGRQIELAGKNSIALTEKEFNFLHLLAQNQQPVPRKSLLVGIGEPDVPEAANRIDMLVYRLRKKVKTATGEELPLRSSYGGGYGLLVPFSLF